MAQVRINDLAAPQTASDPFLFLEPFVALLIVVNAVLLGVQTDARLRVLNPPEFQPGGDPQKTAIQNHSPQLICCPNQVHSGRAHLKNRFTVATFENAKNGRKTNAIKTKRQKLIKQQKRQTVTKPWHFSWHFFSVFLGSAFILHIFSFFKQTFAAFPIAFAFRFLFACALLFVFSIVFFWN